MGTRIVSGIVLLILLIGLLYAGGPVLLTAMLVISLIGLYEFYRALSNQHKPFQIIGLAAAILYYGVLLFREEWVRDGNFGLFFFIGLFWILMVLAVFSYPERRTEDVALTFAGVLYVPVLFSFVYFLRQSQDGMLYAPIFFGQPGGVTPAHILWAERWDGISWFRSSAPKRPWRGRLAASLERWPSACCTED